MRTEVGALKEKEESLKLQVSPLVYVYSVKPNMLLMAQHYTVFVTNGNFEFLNINHKDKGKVM